MPRTPARALTAALALLAGLTSGACAAAQGSASPGHTAGPSNPAVTRTAPEAPALTIMPLGDSITAGTGSRTHSSYRAVLYQRLTAAGLHVDFVGSQRSGAGPDADHEGHPGWTIAQIAGRVDGWLAAYRPDVVLLHIGTNDVTRGADAVPGAPARLAALVDRIRADAPAAQIFVAEVVGSRTPARQAQIDAYDAAIPAIVSRRGPHVHLVDQSAIRGPLLDDSLHPDDDGYATMAGNWYRSMMTVLRSPVRQSTRAVPPG